MTPRMILDTCMNQYNAIPASNCTVVVYPITDSHKLDCGRSNSLDSP